MSESYKHLIIQKEDLINNRRSSQVKRPPTNQDDLLVHGQKLTTDFNRAIQQARQQISAGIEGFVFKFTYAGSLDFTHLHDHGVDFISQEDKQICVVFSDEQGVMKFTDHANSNLKCTIT